MKKLIQKIKAFFVRCRQCGSINVKKGYYTRGWNNWCEQACGDDGYFCYKCCKVSFEKTLDEYKANLPKWCTAYEN